MGPYIYKDMLGFVPSTLEPRVSGNDLSRIFGRSPAMFHILEEVASNVRVFSLNGRMMAGRLFTA